MKNELIKEIIKELEGNEINLLDLDNYIQAKLETTESLFDSEEYVMEGKSVSYYLEEDRNLIIEFEILEKEKDNLYTKVKIINVFEF